MLKLKQNCNYCKMLNISLVILFYDVLIRYKLHFLSNMVKLNECSSCFFLIDLNIKV